jgi:predicted amidohydrolase YtcJ
MQILTHCNGDAASEQFLNAYEKALSESDNPNKETLKPVMIHCQTVRNDQLDRMAAINMIPSIFVGHVYYWGDVHMKNFGPERGNHISPAKDAMDRGLVINFHQDAPITKPNMLHSVWCAVNRISRAGNVIGEDQKIGVYDALKAVTINAAYQYSEEDSKGSIKEGKRADLVVLDKSPLAVDQMEIKDIKVLETIKDGKRIYKIK